MNNAPGRTGTRRGVTNHSAIMAIKKTKENGNLIDTFKEFKETKNIDKATLESVIEESFRSVLQKMYGHDDAFKIIVNPETGDLEIWWYRTVVEDGQVQDEAAEIQISDVRKMPDYEDYEVGEEICEKVKFSDFGRRAILTLRQTMAAKILELEHDNLYNKYKDKVGTIVSGDVHQIWKRETLLLDEEGNELLLPKTEQIPGDFFRKGETTRAIVLRVENQNNNPKIILSRTAPEFLLRLLEQEVPEIGEGLITVRKIARIPGERAKIAVESYSERIDPVGACVGVRGSRIHGIVRELRGENIDVITYTANTRLFIQRALSPARVSSINLDEENHKAEVFLQPDQVSLAIGKNGLNIKLASMITGYTIDVFREIDENEPQEEDIYLEEFADEIEEWVINQLKAIGLDTAKDVLKAPREVLVKNADLEESTVDEVLRILSAEFED